jgi:hypothetical protein
MGCVIAIDIRLPITYPDILFGILSLSLRQMALLTGIDVGQRTENPLRQAFGTQARGF